MHARLSNGSVTRGIENSFQTHCVEGALSTMVRVAAPKTRSCYCLVQRGSSVPYTDRSAERIQGCVQSLAQQHLIPRRQAVRAIAPQEKERFSFQSEEEARSCGGSPNSPCFCFSHGALPIEFRLRYAPQQTTDVRQTAEAHSLCLYIERLCNYYPYAHRTTGRRRRDSVKRSLVADAPYSA